MARPARTVLWLSALLVTARPARGDGLSGLIEEDFARVSTTATDQSGATQRQDSSIFTQRYRLTLERSLFPNLRLQTGGVFEQLTGDSRAQDLVTDETARTTSLFANVLLTAGVLNGALGYTRHEAGTPGAPSLINEEPSLSLGWRPIDLPGLSLRLSRPSVYDSARQAEDVTSELALATVQYAPARPLELKYSLDYERPHDHLHLTDTTSVTQTAAAIYADTLAPWTTSVAATLNATERRTLVTSAGAGGTLATQLFPVAALSLVEVFPAIAALDTLVPNGGLLDGNLTAGAGLDLGFAATLAGDTGERDLGVQFADSITKVNTLYVWVDRPVAPDVAATLSWTAWQSDDNLHWSEVATVGQVVFPLLQNRFEITIAATAARYLKVVTRPLSPTATTDQRLSSVLVTELQAFLVQPVSRSSGWQKSSSQLLTTGLRTQLFGRSDLAYDFQLQASRAEQAGGSLVTYLVGNGLSWSDKLSPIVLASARVARQDLDQSRGHEGAFLYSASLAANELPTLSHSLSYSGQVTTGASGTNVVNSVSFLNRATPYRGVGVMASFSWSGGRSAEGQTNRSEIVTVNATLQPHPALKLGGTYALNDTSASGGGQAALSLRTQRIDGTVSFNPFPALSVAGGVTRVIGDPRSYTLANGALGFSPLQGGELQLTLNLYETLDTAGNVNRLIAPALRWTIHRRTVLVVSYAFTDTSGASLSTHTRTLDLNLKIPL